MAEKYSCDEECIFCKFASGQIKPAIVLENKYVIAFLDINPAGLLVGHTLVVPKEHCITIDKCSDKTLAEVMKAVKALAPAIMKTSEADGINFIQNNGKAAGQFVEHAHFHLIPRKHGDNIIINENRRKPVPMELESTAKAIKAALKK